MRFLLLFVLMTLLETASLAVPRQPNDAPFADLRLGMFVHYMYFGNKPIGTARADGTLPAGVNELADGLDVENLAQTLQDMHAQYLVFTTWHANMNALYPSQIIEHWIPGHASRRDIPRELLKALKPRGIQLILYVHPSDGHDFTPADQARVGWNDPPPYKHWNDFINEVLAEMGQRYGHEIAGYWVDGGLPDKVDCARLRRTILQYNSKAALIENLHVTGTRPLNRSICDYGSQETLAKPYQVKAMQVCPLVGKSWFATPRGAAEFSAEDAFQYTVAQAATRGQTGGGTAWSAGPYLHGKWEPGVADFFAQLGGYITPVAGAIFNTRPSDAYITSESTNGTTLDSLQYVATESKDGTKLFLHVLKRPVGTTLQLPPPVDGRSFTSARLFIRNKPDNPAVPTGLNSIVPTSYGYGCHHIFSGFHCIRAFASPVHGCRICLMRKSRFNTRGAGWVAS